MGKRSVLIITFNFPPYSMPGAVRTAALAKYWANQGRDVHVISSGNINFAKVHKAVEHDNIHSHYIPVAGDKETQNNNPKPQKDADTKAKKASAFRKLLWSLQTIPDRFHPQWSNDAAECAMALVEEIKPEFIFSSAPPQSAHIAASRVKKATGLPWICELRDLWIGNPYNYNNFIANQLNKKMAFSTMGAADGFISVTQYAQKILEKDFKAPVHLAYNGYDPDDFSGIDNDTQPLDKDCLTIVHAGVVYAQRRDPSALFAAIAMLPPDMAKQIRVIFFHDEYSFITELAEKYEVTDCIEMRDVAPREEILTIERAADILLLCRWNDSRDDGIIPGKVFEYIGARRTILAVGSETGEATDIVRQGDFGCVSNDPATIAQQLKRWLVEKKQNGGRLPDLLHERTLPFTRKKQFVQMDEFIEKII